MDKQYISIKEFAERVGKSQQAIYKQLNNKLQTYVKVVESQKMLDIKALKEVYGVEVEQPIQPKVEQVKQPIQPNFDSILSQQQQMIDMLQKELEVKNKQIDDLSTSLANVTESLRMAEMLQANAEKKVLQLEEKSNQEPVEPMQEVVEPDEPPTPPKGFWAKIFKK